MFRPDSNTLVELLIRIQSGSFPAGFVAITDTCRTESPLDPQDTQLSHYLMGTWAKICQAMGPEFEPYLPVVMPDLLATASLKADVSVIGTILYMCTLPREGYTFATSILLMTLLFQMMKTEKSKNAKDGKPSIWMDRL